MRGQAVAGLGPWRWRAQLPERTRSLALDGVGLWGEHLCVLSTPLSHSQSQRVWVLGHLGSPSRRKTNFTAPWAWSGLRRSFKKLGPVEGRSQAAAMGRKTLSVRGQAREVEAEGLGWTVQQRRDWVPVGGVAVGSQDGGGGMLYLSVAKPLLPCRPPPVLPSHPPPTVHSPAS